MRRTSYYHKRHCRELHPEQAGTRCKPEDPISGRLANVSCHTPQPLRRVIPNYRSANLMLLRLLASAHDSILVMAHVFYKRFDANFDMWLLISCCNYFDDF